MLRVSLTKMQKGTIINFLDCKVLIEVKQILVKTLHIFEVAIHCENRLVGPCGYPCCIVYLVLTNCIRQPIRKRGGNKETVP